MVKDNITTAQDVAQATGQSEEEIKQAWQRMKADQLEAADMEPNGLVLNPRSKRSGELKCSRCGEKVVEVSGHYENRFECGCDGLVEFEIPVEDKSGDNDEDSIIEDVYTISKPDKQKCPMCYDGVESSECTYCNGTGEVRRID